MKLLTEQDYILVVNSGVIIGGRRMNIQCHARLFSIVT